VLVVGGDLVAKIILDITICDFTLSSDWHKKRLPLSAEVALLKVVVNVIAIFNPLLDTFGVVDLDHDYFVDSLTLLRMLS